MIYDSKADGVVTVKSALYVTSTTVPVFENVIQSKQFSYGGPVPTDNNTRIFSALGEMKLFIITTQIVQTSDQWSEQSTCNQTPSEMCHYIIHI